MPTLIRAVGKGSTRGTVTKGFSTNGASIPPAPPRNGIFKKERDAFVENPFVLVPLYSPSPRPKLG